MTDSATSSPANQTSFSALLSLLRYAKGHRKSVLVASVYSVLNKLFDVLPEILIGVAIDVIVRREESFVASTGVVDPFNQVLLLGALTIVIWAMESLFEFLSLVAWRNLAQSLQHDLRIDTYSHLQDLDMAWFEDASTGNLVAIMNDDINQLERFLDGGANAMIQVVTAVVLVGAVFFYLSPKIAVIAFMPIPAIIIGAFWFLRRAQPLYATVRERVGILSTRLANNIGGIATIKSFAREQHELDLIRADSESYRQANSRAIRVSSAFIPVIRMAILAGFVSTLVYGGKLTLDGEMQAGAYSVLVFLTQRLLWPLTRVAETVDLYERAMASTRRILKLIATPFQIKSGEQGLPLDGVRGGIEFSDVSFSYSSGPQVLDALNINVRPAQTIALVGQTGSGKSTVVKLLLRFYEPTSGTIKIDGLDLTEVLTSDLRKAIGLVSQDVFLFHGTVKENIRYGKPEASDQEIIDAAIAAEAHEFILKLADGYETIVGERGQKLSGGQRQRISIARAVLKDPPILIMDEATSSVDNETEAAIQRSMKLIAKGRTTIVIAHRLSTIIDADQIYVLENGRIAEQGNHSTLMANDGIYSYLWEVQTGIKS
ncbi:MAG: ATP-binding cassette subfamily B protein [Lysobacterales bacterium]|jgi:ATP-binding cassette subfamily B protein